MAKFTQAMQAGLIVTMIAGIAGLTGCGESEVVTAPPPPVLLTVGGSVSGLSGSGLLLQLNGRTIWPSTPAANSNSPKP